MDKFGIFNLLTSFYDFYQKNKDNGKSENKPNNPLPFNLDFLKSSQPQPKTEIQKEQKNNSLYLSMVNTISSHDKIVKRVTESANKSKTT